MDSNSSGSAKFSRTPSRETNRNNPRDQAKVGGTPTLERSVGIAGEGVLFLLTCGGSVPEREEGEGSWTEMGQRMRFEERFRTGRCLRLQGKPKPTATRIRRRRITEIVSIEL